MSRPVHIVPTGTANLASVRAAIRRGGGEPAWARTAAEVTQAERLVLPGVGTFGASLARVREDGLVEALMERLQADRPTLAVCVGMQLLATGSEESPGAVGLNLVPHRIAAFGDNVRRPQFGWNRVTPTAEDGPWLDAGHAYFANSYRLVDAPTGWRTARADHGGPFIAAMTRGHVLACQFHPELSGPWGQNLINRWLEGGAAC